MKELKVKNIIIGKQFENCNNLQKFYEIAKEKNIKIILAEAGTEINIEKDVHIECLWPDTSNVIKENSINNNSLVFKIIYKDISLLFTGDIEEKTEKELITKYKSKLKCTILKVAHHGSKSSSIVQFLNLAKPQIALIGVGENNKYGHPSNNIISRIKKCGAEIYRTDKDGEINIIIYNKQKIKINKLIYEKK